MRKVLQLNTNIDSEKSLFIFKELARIVGGEVVQFGDDGKSFCIVGDAQAEEKYKAIAAECEKQPTAQA